MNDEEDSYTAQYEIREGIIFLIELSPAIFRPLVELGGRSQFLEILSSINDLMSELLITVPSTGVGIYLYNCSVTGRKFPRDSGMERIFTLNDINSTNMKNLNDMIQDHIDNIKILDERFPPAEGSLKLSTVLNTILDEFHGRSHYNVKRMVWISNNDKPFNDDGSPEGEKIKQNLWKMINNYEEYKINISPIFMDPPSDTKPTPFDISTYQQIFLNTNYLNRQKQSNETETYYDTFFDGLSEDANQTTVASQIRSAILRLKEIKRISFSCDLILGDSNDDIAGRLACSIKGYALYGHEKLKKFKHLHHEGENLRVVQLDSKVVDEGTGDEIQYNEDKPTLAEKQDEAGVRRGFAIGDDEVLFLNSKQMDFLKNYTFDHDPENHDADTKDIGDMAGEEEKESAPTYSPPPYLKLLGFREAKNFEPYYTTSAPALVMPDFDNGLKAASSKGGFSNSYLTLASLYRSCVKLDRFAVVFGCIKRNSLPSLYALYPTGISMSKRGIPHDKDFPEGFLLARMPWLDDIRLLPDYLLNDSTFHYEKEELSVPPELVTKFKNVIGLFYSNHYNPVNFANPSVNYFYKVIKHELLQIALSDESRSPLNNDQTLLTLDDLREAIQLTPKLLNVISELRQHLLNLGPLTRKRTSQEPHDAKKAQRPALTEESVLTAWKNNDWTNFNVPQLREFAKKYPGQIKSGTKRQDIIDNISEFIASKSK
jgi:ATP-dependent DNA helicase 2 subunit 1